MSYQVLARKWRPSSFSQMVGQEHVVKALTTALESERLHHAYLFTGTRGVGKTTVARLIAKSLNCEEGVTATPCGVCASCVEIAEGRSVDVLEVDAASRTKVEDTRELLDNVQYAPTRSRFKIYLIDEVHMLSNHSFNALLKTLEEPPSHVKFLLATTDPQKLPATVLSRCLQFNLKNMVPAQIIEHLQHILSEESVGYDDESLALLARGAEGSMRDALSLTDQAIAHGSGKLAANEVRAMLGTVSRTKVLDLLAAIADNDAKQALAVVDDLATHSPDYSGALDELSSVLHQVAIEQAVPGSLDESLPEFARLQSLSKSLTTDDAQLMWQMAMASKRDLVLASDPRSGLDMAVLRMIAFRPAIVISESAVGSSEAPPAKKSEPPVMPVETPVNPQQKASSSDSKASNTLATAASDRVGTRTPAGAAATPVAPKHDDVAAQPDDSAPENTTETALENEVTLAGVGHPATITSETTNETSETKEAAKYSQAAQVARAPVETAPVEIKGTDSSSMSVASDAHRRTQDGVPGSEKSQPPPVSGSVAYSGDDGPVATVTADPAIDAAPDGAKPPHDDLPTSGSWPDFFNTLDLKGVIHNVASHFELIQAYDRTLCFAIAPENATLYNERHQRGLASAIELSLEDAVEVLVSIQPTSDNTPARHREILEQQRLKAAQAALEEDDFLTALLTDFDATVIPNTVRPPLTEL